MNVAHGKYNRNSFSLALLTDSAATRGISALQFQLNSLHGGRAGKWLEINYAARNAIPTINNTAAIPGSDGKIALPLAPGRCQRFVDNRKLN